MGAEDWSSRYVHRMAGIVMQVCHYHTASTTSGRTLQPKRVDTRNSRGHVQWLHRWVDHMISEATKYTIVRPFQRSQVHIPTAAWPAAASACCVPPH